MKVAVHVTKGAMEGSVFTATVETFLVRPIVDFRRPIMEAIMPMMVARMLVVVVIRHRRRQRQGEAQDAGQ